MKKIAFIIYVLVFFPVCVFSQTTLILQPDSSTGKDALLHNLSSASNTNFGTDTQLPAEAWTFNGAFAVLRGLIEFDLSSIPQGSIINSAYLSLYANDASSGLGQHSAIGVSNNAWLERVTSPWNEFTVTWNNQPSATTVNRVAVPASTSPSEDYLNMDVTTLTQDIISSPSGNFGIMLILDVEQTFRRLNFCTSDYPDSTKHPKLEISYVAPSAIDEITQANSFLIYQNPVNNFLTIKFLKAINETITYQVLDAIGESVSQEFTIPGNSKLEQMNISTLKSGLYFLKIKTNGLFFTRRFVKK